MLFYTQHQAKMWLKITILSTKRVKNIIATKSKNNLGKAKVIPIIDKVPYKDYPPPFYKNILCPPSVLTKISIFL